MGKSSKCTFCGYIVRRRITEALALCHSVSQYLSKAYYRNIRVVQSDPSRLPRLSTPTIVSYLSGEPDEDPRDRIPTSRKRDERLAILCKDPDGDVVGIWDQNQDVKESKRIETTGGIMRCKACGSSIRTIYPCRGHKNLHLYIW